MTNNLTITHYEAFDIRFPTSINKDGSDAMNKDSDYSAAYIILYTEKSGLEGHGLTFTLGRGNEICVTAIHALAPKLIGSRVKDLVENIGATYKMLISDSQLRWIGPEKGAIHLGTAAVINAVWDLYAKIEGKPIWKLIADFTPEQYVAAIDFRYIEDAITPTEALELLRKNESSKAIREKYILENGYPAYTTSVGWLGYSDEKVRRLCEEAKAQGFTHFKQKVGSKKEDDINRARLMREVLGKDAKLMMDANQVWGVNEAIAWMQDLLEFEPWWIEEPTSPDDILGHAKIRAALYPKTRVATGEHIQNRVIFKQLLQANGIDFVQVDAARMGGLNEVLAVLLLAAKFGKPVCPHAGGVGLCEYVQHISMIDYICVSASLEDRIVEFVDHLHENFISPCVIKDGAYVAPSTPGYSIEMYRSSIDRFIFPQGVYWTKEHPK